MLQLNVPFDSHVTINKWARQYGPLFKIFVGHTPVVIATGEAYVTVIFAVCEDTCSVPMSLDTA